jgi:hypothetical protein
MRTWLSGASVFAILAVALAFLPATMLQGQVTQEVKKFPSPFLLASAGQSPDATLVKLASQKEKLTFTYKPAAEAADLAGVRCVVVVMGVSMKGLGAAGVKLPEDLARVDSLIAEAKKKDIPVIGFFAGGAGGRGGRDSYTDEVIRTVAPKVNYLVAVRSADKDGFISGLASAHQVPLSYFNTIMDMGKTIAQMFK